VYPVVVAAENLPNFHLPSKLNRIFTSHRKSTKKFQRLLLAAKFLQKFSCPKMAQIRLQKIWHISQIFQD